MMEIQKALLLVQRHGSWSNEDLKKQKQAYNTILEGILVPPSLSSVQSIQSFLLLQVRNGNYIVYRCFLFRPTIYLEYRKSMVT